MESTAKRIVQAFAVNRDANPTNRGFYYQYLSLLSKWLQNFMEEKHTLLYSEVEDDIKEIGEELVFTQIKSFTGTFSLNSPDVHKALFNFYILFLKYENEIQGIKFVFQTNTGIKKNEKLLSDWIKDPTLSEPALKEKCLKRLREIIAKQFKSQRDKMISKVNTCRAKKVAVKEAYKDAISQIDDLSFNYFLGSILWQFQDIQPDVEIKNLESKILQCLENAKFKGYPPETLVNCLLSEIYRRSSASSQEERKLTIDLLDQILAHSVEELNSYINDKLLKVFHSNYFKLISSVNKMPHQLEEHSKDIHELKQRANSLSYPKELTFVPTIFPGEILGRDGDIRAIEDSLSTKRVLILNGIGGIGKSSVVKAIAENAKTTFNHIVWVNGTNGLKNAFVLHEVLINNLQLVFSIDQTIDKRYDELANAIKNIKGKILIVIDDLVSEDKLNVRAEVEKLYRQDIFILISTRERQSLFCSFEIAPLSFEFAKALTQRLCPSRPCNDGDLMDFFDSVGYNTLMIELCARTIESSLDLTFSKLTDFFKKNELDTESLNIDISLQFDSSNNRLFSQLLNTFEISKLDRNEVYTLELLSILPSELIIGDFIAVYGAERYEINKNSVMNLFNVLHGKGWIQREGTIIRMHKLVQIAVRYQIINFVGFSFFINYLCHRLRERNQYLTYKGMGFVFMAQSILDSIKEKDRSSIFQPLIVLEVNLLESYRQLGDTEKFIEPMINMIEIGESKLGEDSIDVAVIYNNASIAYHMRGDTDTAINLSKRAIAVLSTMEAEYHRNLIISIDSLTALLIQEGRVEEINGWLQRSIALRNKYLQADDALFALQLNNIGGFYLKLNYLDEAITAFKLAIVIHNDSTKEKNDFHLAMYHCNLSVCLLFKGQLEKAERHQLKAIEMLEKSNQYKNHGLLQCYLIMSSIYQENGNMEKAEIYFKKSVQNPA